MLNSKDSQIELDLIAGDELLKEFSAANLKISASTKQQYLGEIKILQLKYKSYSKMKPKRQLIVGPVCFFLGLFILFTVPPTAGAIIWTGIFLFMEPLVYAILYFTARSGSRKYMHRISELKSMISKAA